jgi:hypothetical protein
MSHFLIVVQSGFKLSAIMLCVIMLSAAMLTVIVPSAVFCSVIVLGGIRLNVVAPRVQVLYHSARKPLLTEKAQYS